MSKIVERTLDFLELFAREKRPLSLSDISRLLAIPVSSCHDVLQALQERGFIYEIAPRSGYYPTVRLYELGKLIIENDPVVLRADLLLRELRNAVDETVLLAKITGMSGTYLLTFEATHPLRYQIQPGDTVANFPVSSPGMAFLGSLDESQRAEALAGILLEQLTPNTPRTIEALGELIALGRRRGYYVSSEHSIEGLTAVSASFLWQQTLYAVTIAGPTARITSRMEAAAALLIDTCRRLEMKTSD